MWVRRGEETERIKTREVDFPTGQFIFCRPYAFLNYFSGLFIWSREFGPGRMEVVLGQIVSLYFFQVPLADFVDVD